MHKLQRYAAGEPVYDNNAYTVTSTYHASTLNMYATHITPSGPGGSPEYHMSQIDGWNTIGNPNTCRQGLTHLRNSRFWTQKERDQFILAANERARSLNAEQSTLDSSKYNGVSDTTDSYPVEESHTSVDELAATSFAYPAKKPDYDDLSAS